MDMRTNEFVMAPSNSDDPFLIPFSLGEEVEIKGYKFRIEHIDVDKKEQGKKKPTLLVLSPIGPRKDVRELADLVAK